MLTLYVRSFLSLSAEYIVTMAKSPVGSQVLEAFLGVVEPPKLKKKFIKKLYTHFIEVCGPLYVLCVHCV